METSRLVRWSRGSRSSMMKQHDNKKDPIVMDRNEKVFIRIIRYVVMSPINECNKRIDRKESTHT